MAGRLLRRLLAASLLLGAAPPLGRGGRVRLVAPTALRRRGRLPTSAAVPVAGAGRPQLGHPGAGRSSGEVVGRVLVPAAIAATLGAPGAKAEVAMEGKSTIEMLDANGDGLVDLEEFMLRARDAMNNLGERAPEVRKEVFGYIQELYDACDIDRDGFLNDREVAYADFLAAVENEKGESFDGTEDFGAAEALSVHQAMDEDGDGLVTRHEFDAALPGAVDFGRVFSMADIDGDEKLSPREAHLASFFFHEYIVAESASTLFRMLDADNDSFIQRREVKDMIARAEADGYLEIATYVDEHFSHYDEDGNGRLDVMEALHLCTGIVDRLADDEEL